MKPADVRFVLGCALAVVVPAAALHFGAPDERLKVGMTAAPFGWPRVLVAHLVTVLPLGLLAARRFREVPAVNEVVRGVWLALGGALTGGAVLVCPGIGEVLHEGGFAAVPLLVLRALIAFVLVLPWCVLALAPPDPGSPRAATGGWAALAVGFALVPVGLYAEAVSAAQTERAADLVRRERVARAAGVLAGLTELGSDLPVADKAPAERLAECARTVQQLREVAGRTLPPSAPTRARFDRALVLIQLDRPGEAAELLEPLATPNDDTVTLLLATVYQDQERWADSDFLYSQVLERQGPRVGGDSRAAGACGTAIEGLAFNARADRRPADAERAFQRGLELIPGRAAEFHFQLGRHYHDGGRPGPALEHLRESVRLDPTRAEAAEKLIRQIRTATPSCFFLP